MGYKYTDWQKRIAERTDLSTQVIHLTKASNEDGKTRSALDNLKKILKDKKILPSGTEGFINGTRKAVCFQDAPLYAVTQNVYFEQKIREETGNKKKRYSPIGLMFDKSYVYKKGGRPVIYEDSTNAKAFLPKDQWWRIVHFNLADKDRIIDWTHEREWRCPDKYHFSIRFATLLFQGTKSYREFVEWDIEQEEPILPQVKGVVVLGRLLY